MPSEQRRLHPASTVRDVPARQVLGGLAPLLVVVGSFGWQVVVGVSVLALVVLGTVRVLAWQRHTYELTDDEIIERKGVLNRRERIVELARIQQVEINRAILDQLLGTAEVRIETAGDSGQSEFVLRVVAEAEAERLRHDLRAHAGAEDGAEDAAEPSEVVLVEVPIHHVLLAAVTGTRLLIVPAVLVGLLGILDDLQLLSADPSEVGALATGVGTLGVVGIALGLAVVGIVGAAITGAVRDGDFRLADRDGDLHVRRGLLSTREAVVPRSRVQRVTVKRNWIRRALGYGTVTLHSAGGRGQRGAGEQRSLTIPLLPERALGPFVRELLRRGALPPLQPHPARGRARAMFRWLRRIAFPLVGAVWVASWLLSPEGAVVVLVAGLLAPVPLGLLEHRHLGNGEDAGLVCSSAPHASRTSVRAAATSS